MENLKKKSLSTPGRGISPALLNVSRGFASLSWILEVLKVQRRWIDERLMEVSQKRGKGNT